MPTFDSQDVYNKHQVSCECEGDCSCGAKDDCGCCPPGLVAIKDCDGNVSCVTPNDAACLEVAKHIPAEGYVKLYDPVTNAYLGDVTTSDALNYIATIDPAIQAPSVGNDFNIRTVGSVSVPVAAPAGTSSGQVDFIVDRISCEQPVVLTLVAPPAGVSFLGGATSIAIPEGQSNIIDGILIDDQSAIGAYNLTVQYSGCAISKTKVLTLNVV